MHVENASINSKINGRCECSNIPMTLPFSLISAFSYKSHVCLAKIAENNVREAGINKLKIGCALDWSDERPKLRIIFVKYYAQNQRKVIHNSRKNYSDLKRNRHSTHAPLSILRGGLRASISIHRPNAAADYI